MLRKAVLVIAFLYFAGLASYSALMLQGRPALLGVPQIGIGEWGSEHGITYISGRRLDCESFADSPLYSTQCTLPIQDDLLTVRAMTRDGRWGGRCEAEYRGQSYDCQQSIRAGTLRGAALIRTPLELSPSEAEGLRDRYWAENSKVPYVPLIALVSAVVAVAAGVAWKPPAAGEGRRRLAGYGVVAGLAFVSSCILLFVVTLHLWD